MRIEYLQFLQGANTQISPFLMGDDMLEVQDNVVTSHKLGAILKRPGYSQVGGALDAKPITGLHNFRQSSATQKMLATCNSSDGADTELFYYTDTSTTVDVESASGQKVVSVASTTGFIAGDIVILAKGYTNEETKVIDTISVGVSITLTENLTNTHAENVVVEQSWTNITLSTTWDGYEDTTVEMEDYLGYCFFVGYGATDGFLPTMTFTGTTTVSETTNITNAPQAKFIKRYRDRLYMINLYDGGALPYRVGISDAPVAGSIGWTEYQAGTGFIDVDYSEGLIGGGVNWDRLMLFTEYSAYMYDQSTKKKVWDVGCSNHRTIKNSGAYMIWANQDGVWMSTGGRPQNIAGRVLDFIKGSTPSAMFAEVVDEEYHLYVGNVTVNGISYSNCSLIYNIPTQTWRWHEYHDGIEIFARYNDSGDDRLYMGTTDGEVMNLGKYTDGTLVNSDDGNDIQAFFRTKPFDFGMADKHKRLIEMTAFSNRAQGLQLKSRIINKNSGDLIKPKPLMQLNKYIETATPKVEQGELLQIEGVEVGQNPYFSLYGFSMDVELATK